MKTDIHPYQHQISIKSSKSRKSEITTETIKVLQQKIDVLDEQNAFRQRIIKDQGELIYELKKINEKKDMDLKQMEKEFRLYMSKYNENTCESESEKLPSIISFSDNTHGDQQGIGALYKELVKSRAENEKLRKQIAILYNQNDERVSKQLSVMAPPSLPKQSQSVKHLKLNKYKTEKMLGGSGVMVPRVDGKKVGDGHKILA